MKKEYIAPKMWVTPYEATHILARSKPGYAIDNEEHDDSRSEHVQRCTADCLVSFEVNS